MKKFYYANTASAACVIEDIKKRSFLRGLKKGLKMGCFLGVAKNTQNHVFEYFNVVATSLQ